MASSVNSAETRARLSACWEVKLDWDLYPGKVKEVCGCTIMKYDIMFA